MIYWNANFQIPNSGWQAADVYVFINEENNIEFYSDKQKTNLLFTKELIFPNVVDKYEYLLSLKEFEYYIKI